MQLEEIIRNAPGFIGNTASNYSLLFRKYLHQSSDEAEDFKKAFMLVIMHRILMSEIEGRKEGNLLYPIHIKGVDEIYSSFDKMNIGSETNFKLDLPTMILYSMLLESEYFRITFEKEDTFFHKISLEAIHLEVVKICPKQIKFNLSEFVQKNIPLLIIFLDLHKSRAQRVQHLGGAIAAMFGAGGYKPGTKGDMPNLEK